MIATSPTKKASGVSSHNYRLLLFILVDKNPTASSPCLVLCPPPPPVSTTPPITFAMSHALLSNYQSSQTSWSKIPNHGLDFVVRLTPFFGHQSTAYLLDDVSIRSHPKLCTRFRKIWPDTRTKLRTLTLKIAKRFLKASGIIIRLLNDPKYVLGAMATLNPLLLRPYSDIQSFFFRSYIYMMMSIHFFKKKKKLICLGILSTLLCIMVQYFTQ